MFDDRLFLQPDADFDGVLDLLVPALIQTKERFVVLIDGGSGSGKTTLAVALQASLVTLRVPAQLVSLDQCYPGWSGLAAASAMVTDTMLDPVTPGYRRWDWQKSEPAEWVELDADRPLIIEGCGALTPMNAADATLGIWVHRDPLDRKAAALVRDRGAFEPHWDHWAGQEHRHWAAHRPWNLAGLVVVVGPG
ncbi:cobalt ABC transporter [Granulicoccus sp. GXG6511]|uniref:cobalt ABC transporter n=1 Tax=Granulicoccus sp. GXG6511 TaxID=3381351 RepID=UPI003D7F0149